MTRILADFLILLRNPRIRGFELFAILNLSTQLRLSCDRHFMMHPWAKMTDDTVPLLREQESANV